MRHKRSAWLGAVLLGFAAAVFPGCEDAPDTESMQDYLSQTPYQSEARPAAATPLLGLSPQSFSGLGSGEVRALTVSGGFAPYAWTVAIPANGSVTAQPFDRQAVYTHAGATNDVNNVIVTDRDGRVAIANVN